MIALKSSVFPAWLVLFIFFISLSLISGCMAPRKTLEGVGAKPYTSYEIMQMQKKMDSLARDMDGLENKLAENEAALARIAEDMKKMGSASMASSLASGGQTEASLSPMSSSDISHVDKNSDEMPGTSLIFPSAQTPEALYRKGRAHLMDNKYEPAEKLFRQLAEQYPDHRLAVNALYWMGECHYAMQDYHGAIMIFKKLLKEYPEGIKAPDALLKTAYSYLSIDETEKAHHYLKMVVKQFPFSAAGEQAEEKLKLFQ